MGWVFVQAGLCGGAVRAGGSHEEAPWLVTFVATVLGLLALTDRWVGRPSRPPTRASDLVVVLVAVGALGAPLALAAVTQARTLAFALAVVVPAAAVAAALAAAVAERLDRPWPFWLGIALASGFVQVPSGREDLSWLAVLGCSAPGVAIALLVSLIGWGQEPTPGRARRIAGALGVGAAVAAARVWTAVVLHRGYDSDDTVDLVIFAGTIGYPLLAPALIERCLGATPPVSGADAA